MIFIFLALAILVKLVWDARKYHIGPTPTAKKIQKEVFKLIESHPEKKSICDLGAGFGFFSLALAIRFPNKTIYSIESAFIPYIFLKILHTFAGLKNWEVERRDFFELPKIKGDIVYCYLYHDQGDRISKHLEKALLPNSLVIASTFKLKLKHLKTIKAPDLYQTPVYLFIAQ